MCILIVDDSSLARIAMSNILRLDGHDDIRAVDSGPEALAFLRSNPHVDAILMDVMMPGMDGIETVKRLRALEGCVDVPVLMVSAGDDDERVKAAFDAGAIDFVPKPIRRLELCARVRSALRLKLEMDKRKARERDLETLNARLHSANLELARQARTDGLTGVANRAAFNDLVHVEWARAARQQQPIALVIIDVDHFKAYNDSYGHPAGDQCLIEVARLVHHQARRSGDVVARYGGEEFVILLPNTDLAGAADVAERVRRAVRSARLPHATSTTAGHVTVSVGAAAAIPPPGIGPGPLIDRADAALYTAKNTGRDCVVSRQVRTMAPPPPPHQPHSAPGVVPHCAATGTDLEARCQASSSKREIVGSAVAVR